MRKRERIISSLEAAYREAFERARETGDKEEMARLDFQFLLDQIQLEVLFDIRDLLGTLGTKEESASEVQPSLLKEGSDLIEKAEALRRITRLR